MNQALYFQESYRHLVRAFSTPVSWQPEKKARDPQNDDEFDSLDLKVSRSFWWACRTLLDAQTSFAYVSSQAESDRAQFLATLQALTGALQVVVEQADFVLVDGDSHELSQVLTQVGLGTLTDPHLGATILWLVRDDDRASFEISGPGLALATKVELPFSREADWVKARNQACIEFPLGCDILIFSSQGLAGIPRSTQISEVPAWDM